MSNNSPMASVNITNLSMGVVAARSLAAAVLSVLIVCDKLKVVNIDLISCISSLSPLVELVCVSVFVFCVVVWSWFCLVCRCVHALVFGGKAGKYLGSSDLWGLRLVA